MPIKKKLIKNIKKDYRNSKNSTVGAPFFFTFFVNCYTSCI